MAQLDNLHRQLDRCHNWAQVLKLMADIDEDLDLGVIDLNELYGRQRLRFEGREILQACEVMGVT